MAKRKGLSRALFQLARGVRNLEVMASGSPRKAAGRVRNELLGRRLLRIFRW